MRKISSFILCAMLLVGSMFAHAAEYSLAVHPIQPPDQLEGAYGPLANYLSEKTGHTIKIKSFSGFKSYWYNMKRLKGFDMVIDAAHFVDHRIKKFGYRVLAKIPDTVSYTLVTNEDLFIFEVEELIGRRVATMDAPGVGGLRLMEMFIGADSEPMTIGSYDADDSIKHLREGRADAAVIPTPLVNKYENLNVVLTTKPIPHVGFSVSPDIPENLARVIKGALLEADATDKGRAALKAANLPLFIDANADVYDGYSALLEVLKSRKRKLRQ